VGFGLNFQVCSLFKEILFHIAEWRRYSKLVGLQICCRNRSYLITRVGTLIVATIYLQLMQN